MNIASHNDRIALYRLLDGYSVHSADLPTMGDRWALDRLVALGAASCVSAAGGGGMGPLYSRGPLFWDAVDACGLSLDERLVSRPRTWGY